MSDGAETISVLIVEDDREFVDFLATRCREQGLAATAVTSLVRAREELGLRRYDVLVADLSIADDDGIALVRHARGACPDIGIVGMTIVAGRLRLRDPGASEYLVKPFHWEDLILSITRLAPRGCARACRSARR